MKKSTFFLLALFLTSCLSQNTTPTNDISTNIIATVTTSPTLTPVPTLSITPSPTHTVTPTVTPLPTRYHNGRLNCPGSIALMYHQIYASAVNNTDFLENGNDIGSMEKVIQYLVATGYYFPTPEEFAGDIKTGVCRHKYAIMVIDDSWNDPEEMGVTEVLVNAGGGTGLAGTPKVWFAVITRQMVPYIDKDGQTIDPWVHLDDLMSKQLVYVVSHSQTHPLPIDRNDPGNRINFKVYRQIGGELLPSRKDILRETGTEPNFFVYPGGYVADPIISGLSAAGYKGAFTVWEGGLDGSLPYYLPRINGGSRCGTTGTDNSDCVIEKIMKYSTSP